MLVYFYIRYFLLLRKWQFVKQINYIVFLYFSHILTRFTNSELRSFSKNSIFCRYFSLKLDITCILKCIPNYFIEKSELTNAFQRITLLRYA